MTAEAQQSTPQASTIIDVLGAAGPRPPRPSSLSTDRKSVV